MTEEKIQATDVTVQKPAPARPLSRFEEMEQLFGSMLPARDWLRPRFGEMMAAFESRFPQIDVLDKEDDVVVRAEIPGMSKDQLDISLIGDCLTIKGQSREEKQEDAGGRYVRREIRSESFERSVTLPVAVDAEKAVSSFKDGVLELTLPKLEKVKAHKISVG